MQRKTKCALSLVLVILVLINYTPFSSAALNFDGTQSSWAEQELQEAYESGLTYAQIENNYLNPITREEFCVVVVKLYEKLGGKAPTLGANPFTDTSNEEILKAYFLGIVKGTSDTTFSPANNITRQEICVMILRALNACKPDIETNPGDDFSFEDASSIATWALDAMKFAYKNNIMKGTSETTISPLNNTNREQAIILLKRTFTKFSETPADQTEVDVADYYAKLSQIKTSYGLQANKNIKPFVPANDSGSLSYSEFNSGSSSSVTLPGTGVTIQPSTGTGLTIQPGTGTGATLQPGSGLSLGMSDSLHKMTPEEIEEYWERQYGYDEYEEFVPSRPWIKADDNVAGVEFLGRGYDVITGKFADPYSLKSSVLNLNKLAEAKRLFKDEGSGTDSRYVEGKSAKSYSKEMATKVGVSGGYLYFRGSVNVNFSSSSLTETDRRFATLVSDLSQYRIEIDDRHLNFFDYLDPIFKQDINNPEISPKEIFQMYGTHVVRSIKMGGRLDYNATANSIYNSESHNFETEVKASFNAAFASANINHQNSQSTTSTSFEENCETNIKAYPAYQGSNSLNPADYRAWLELAQKNPAMVDFGQERPLIPIWNMATTQVRRNQLKMGYEQYAAENQHIPPSVINCINGIRLHPQPVGTTLAGLDEKIIIDPVTNEKWELIANVSPHNMRNTDIQQQIYVRRGPSDLESKPPVVAVFLVNETQGENAKAIFDKYWGNDPTARLWGDGGESGSDPSLNSYISNLPVGDKLKLYYVTSTSQRPITDLRVKHYGYDGIIRYYPSIDSDNPSTDYGSYFSVMDYGTHMNSGKTDPQDCAERTPEYVLHRNIYLQFTYE